MEAWCESEAQAEDDNAMRWPQTNDNKDGSGDNRKDNARQKRQQGDVGSQRWHLMLEKDY